MKVYIVITTHNAEFKGQVDGVFEKYEDAYNRYKGIIEDWERWAKGDKVETYECEHIFYCMTNFSQEEYREVKIEVKELTRREKHLTKAKEIV